MKQILKHIMDKFIIENFFSINITQRVHFSPNITYDTLYDKLYNKDINTIAKKYLHQHKKRMKSYENDYVEINSHNLQI